MKRYRLFMEIEDEQVAEDGFQAYQKFQQKLTQGFYGPTKEQIEELEEVPAETETETTEAPER